MTVRNRNENSKKRPHSPKYSDKLKDLILQKDTQLWLSKQPQPVGVPPNMHLVFWVSKLNSTFFKLTFENFISKYCIYSILLLCPASNCFHAPLSPTEIHDFLFFRLAWNTHLDLISIMQKYEIIKCTIIGKERMISSEDINLMYNAWGKTDRQWSRLYHYVKVVLQ